MSIDKHPLVLTGALSLSRSLSLSLSLSLSFSNYCRLVSNSGHAPCSHGVHIILLTALPLLSISLILLRNNSNVGLSLSLSLSLSLFSLSRTLLLFTCRTSTPIDIITGHERTITSIAWSPHAGNTLASCGVDKCVRIWDVYTGRQYRTVGIPDRYIYRCIHYM
eukprot:TRINITY_DN2570_c0_g1_i1.p1 TRINITY_DN2570_c0_g1~~TRINITY_DN2570_c0_g1_i1.p1  ORF type:complete len:164 (-),score=29.83 TRINITY_DN2570_c0_g1_i1:84-575(-)